MGGALVQDRVALTNTSIVRPTACFNHCAIVALDYPALTRQALLLTPILPTLCKIGGFMIPKAPSQGSQQWVKVIGHH